MLWVQIMMAHVRENMDKNKLIGAYLISVFIIIAFNTAIKGAFQ